MIPTTHTHGSIKYLTMQQGKLVKDEKPLVLNLVSKTS